MLDRSVIEREMKSAKSCTLAPAVVYYLVRVTGHARHRQSSQWTGAEH